MDTSAQRIGDLTLTRRLGQGAWGEVWSAHRADRRVAVKFLVPGRGRYAVARAAFDDEIRLMARADHPNVVALLDQGVVPDDGPLHPGAPFLVMAHADGALDPSIAVEAARWLAILDAVLAGLAHLHARRVVHRDVKPSNILIFREPGGERFALADLGIAWDLGDAGNRPAGTPGFMAPEQANGQWIGPAADLYAVGAVAHVLATGRLPDQGGDARRPLPPGAWAWIRRMLSFDPRDRFPTAAHARAALGLPEGDWQPPEPVLPTLAAPSRALGPADGAQGTWRDGSTWGFDEASHTLAPELDGALAPEPDLGGRAPIPRAPPGLGLFGLREPPLIGREAAQTTLWDAWRAARAGASKLVWLRGEAGVGKRRLARWLCEAIAEAGLAPVWRVPFTSSGRAGTGLWFAVEQQLRAMGRDAAPWDASLPPRARAARALDLWVDAPVVWLDVPSPSEEADALVALWLARGDVPALVLVTGPGPWPDAEPLEVPPVPRAALADMLERWLAIDTRLALEVARRTDGNPQFAVQLVSDWVRRGLLVATSTGFEISGDEMPAVPASVVALWENRVASVGLSPPELRVAWAAAIVGDPVDDASWAATAWADVAAVKTKLVSAGLATVDDDGLRFVSRALRESLVWAAEASGAAERLHRRAAAHLRSRDVDPGRVGQHLAAAGDHAAAVPLLVAGAAAARHRHASERAVTLARRALAALDALGVPEAHPDRVGPLYELGVALEVSWRARDAVAPLMAAAALAEASAHWGVLVGARLRLANIYHQSDDVDAAFRALAAAEDAAIRAEDPRRALVAVARSVIFYRLGRRDEATVALDRAESLAVDDEAMARVLTIRGVWMSSAGDDFAAEALFRRAAALAPVSTLLRHAQATTLWRLGRLAEAEQEFRELVAEAEVEGARAERAACNLAQCLSHLGRHTEARAVIDRWLPRIRRSSRRLVLVNALGTAAAIALHLGDLAAFDIWAAEAADLAHEVRRSDRDVAALLRSAPGVPPRQQAVAEALALLFERYADSASPGG